MRIKKAERIMNKSLFFSLYRRRLDKDNRITQREVEAIDFFLDSFLRFKKMFTIPQWAYIFATTFHETGHTFEPVKEAFRLSEDWRKRNLRYYPYYGRGYVQLTWRENYEKYSKVLGMDLVNNPDLALEKKNSFLILIDGMKNGSFTGKRLDTYINKSEKDYIRARYVVNGKDKRDLIASYATIFEEILLKTT